MKKDWKAPIALGCMRIPGISPGERETLITEAMERGINFFDHADIYGAGKSEEVFAQAVANLKIPREDMILQSKCGIRDGFFDFSKEHILRSVDQILTRLNTDYLDILLLHRPDALVEPEEVADAFDTLYQAGKVKKFGVSNHNPYQIELLQKSVTQKIAYNQLQFSIMHSGMIDAGLNVNMRVDNGINRDGSILDYCRLKEITIQAWSPFQYGFFEGVFMDNDKFPELNAALKELALKYGVEPSAVAVAWINRHPAGIQTIIGTTNVQRVKDISQAVTISLSREEWYRIYKAAGNILP